MTGLAAPLIIGAANKSDGTLYLWGPAGTANDRVLRVPTVMTTFALSSPRKP